MISKSDECNHDKDGEKEKEMINLEYGTKLTTDFEVLDNVAEYIRCSVGSQDWEEHIGNISGYIGAGIQKHEQEVVGYLMAKLNLK
jgi:hypothetical protein